MSNENQPLFSIEKVYIKDLSVEVPNAPEIFLERANPAINIQLRNEGKQIGEGLYDVTLTVTVSAELEESKRSMFLVEAAQSGVFQIVNVPEQDIEPLLMVACPNILFPYARETVSDAITRAGFQPVLLAPVNFESLYQSRQQQQAHAPVEVPVQ